MNEYKKSIDVEIKLNKKSIEKAEKDLDGIKNIKINTDDIDELAKKIVETQNTLNKMLKDNSASAADIAKQQKILDETMLETDRLGTKQKMDLLELIKKTEQEIEKSSKNSTKEVKAKTKEIEKQKETKNKENKEQERAQEKFEKSQAKIGSDLGKTALSQLGGIGQTASSAISAGQGAASQAAAAGMSGGSMAAAGAVAGAAVIAAKAIEYGANTIKDAITQGREIANELLNASKLSSPETRETMFQYGFDYAQSYGWQQAMEALGFSSEEDLWYADPEQQQLFWDTMEQFANTYTTLANDGFFKELTQYNVEMATLKKEYELEQAKFYVENKDVIKKYYEVSFRFQSAILEFIAELGRVLFNDKSLSSSEVGNIMSDYKYTNTTFNINNTSYDTHYANQKSTRRTQKQISLDNTLNIVAAGIGG